MSGQGVGTRASNALRGRVCRFPPFSLALMIVIGVLAVRGQRSGGQMEATGRPPTSGFLGSQQLSRN
jgi:hypothetical protein